MAKSKDDKINLYDVRLLLQWVNEIENEIEDGEMVYGHGYNTTYFGFAKEISCKTLNVLIDTINPLLKELDYKTRINWVAGEIRPITDLNKVKILDDIYAKSKGG